MSVTLRLNSDTTIPIRVEGILPETTRELASSRIAKLKIWYGNRQEKLGDLFEVRDGSDSCDILWQGDLSAVHWIGHALKSGNMLIEGNAGRHLGSQMTGGGIEVHGNAGDYAGCEATGGLIRVHGNVGNWPAAAYPGSRAGVNRGTLVVFGNAGSGAAFAMRRGLVWIGGNVGRLPGWNMLGGTVIIGGEAGDLIGKGMVRGTILLVSQQLAVENRRRLPPTFTSGSTCSPVFVSLLQRELQQMLPDGICSSLKPEHQYLKLYHGDHLKGGRGEVWIPADSISSPPEH